MADGSVKIEITADDSDVKTKLDGVGDAADDAAGGLDNLGNSADAAGKGIGAADIAVGTFIANGLTALTGALFDAVGSFASLAQETQAYRDDMAKLDVAFTTAGHSTETANSAYKSFYAILGESDRSVEAVNHLAELTKNEQEVAQWATIAAGVTAKFGDSLPIEGLTEAANETAKVGQVTGPLADALNWAGISEDEFNKKLAECTSEQQRASLITSTLNGEYSAAAAEYNKMTASTQEARLATAEMEQAQANLGAALEPLTTAWTNLKAGAFQWISEVGLPAVQSGFNWLLNNIPTVVGIIGTLTAAWLTFGGAQQLIDGWNKAVAISQAALNVVMNANPIGLIITAIGLLVTAFITLWNNCEEFRNFFINLWETIKNAVGVAVDAIAGFFSGLWDGIVAVWETVAGWFNTYVIEPIAGFFKGLWDGIVSAYHAVIDPWIEIVKRIATIIYDNVIKPVADFFKGLWESITGWASAAWDGIVSVWNAVAGWFNKNIIQPVSKFFSGMWDGFKNGAKKAWEGVKSVFSAVAGFFKDIFTKAWEGVKSVFSTMGNVFVSIKDGIVSVFKTVVNGLIKGINFVVALPFEGLNKILDKIHGIEIVGVQPFGWLTWRAPIPQLPLLAKGGVVNKATAAVIGEDGAEAVVPLERNTGWIDKLAKSVSAKMSAAAMIDRIKANVIVQNAGLANTVSPADNGMSDLARAVGVQTAGISSLAHEYRGGSMRPVVLELNGRELGRAVVDVGSAETSRVGTRLVMGV